MDGNLQDVRGSWCGGGAGRGGGKKGEDRETEVERHTQRHREIRKDRRGCVLLRHRHQGTPCFLPQILKAHTRWMTFASEMEKHLLPVLEIHYPYSPRRPGDGEPVVQCTTMYFCLWLHRATLSGRVVGRMVSLEKLMSPGPREKDLNSKEGICKCD